MNKLFLFALFFVFASVSCFSSEQTDKADSLRFENIFNYNYDSIEIKGRVTIDDPPKNNKREPVNNGYASVYYESDSKYVYTESRECRVYKNRISTMLTNEKGEFSFKLIKGKYLLHIDFDASRICDPHYIYVHLDGKDKVIDLGDIELCSPIFIVNYDDSEHFKKKRTY
ncbi:MAG: hypothetical protein R3Y51_02335 [Rikenellaceae bacterium]